MGNRSSRGQVLSTEVVVCMGLFTAALIALLAAWNSMHQSYLDEAGQAEMATALAGISDMAVLSPGEPAGWEAGEIGDASAIGLASSPNVLSERKLSALQSLDETQYSEAKERMGAGRFGLYLSVSDAGGVIHSFGRQADYSDSSVQALDSGRLALLDGKVVRVRVQLWRKRGGGTA